MKRVEKRESRICGKSKARREKKQKWRGSREWRVKRELCEEIEVAKAH